MFSDLLPLFPLPNVVLFPGVFLPLHIFEPRYKEMVADALAGDRIIGMALLRPGWEADYEGRPPIYPYYYAPPRRPGGWSFYFGPVPYAKGDYETQALQRVYPQLNYPPSMRYWTPRSGF